MTESETDYETIGALVDALRPLDKSAAIYIDNKPPTELMSYRGYYNHLAIACSGSEHESTAIDVPGEGFDISIAGMGWYQPGASEVTIAWPATVGELSDALSVAVGATFEGYKGGQYVMTKGTQLWVSEYGQCDERRIVAVEILPGRVDLMTREVEW